jgi:hypothetical protein
VSLLNVLVRFDPKTKPLTFKSSFHRVLNVHDDPNIAELAETPEKVGNPEYIELNICRSRTATTIITISVVNIATLFLKVLFFFAFILCSSLPDKALAQPKTL